MGIAGAVAVGAVAALDWPEMLASGAGATTAEGTGGATGGAGGVGEREMFVCAPVFGMTGGTGGAAVGAVGAAGTAGPGMAPCPPP